MMNWGLLHVLLDNNRVFCSWKFEFEPYGRCEFVLPCATDYLAVNFSLVFALFYCNLNIRGKILYHQIELPFSNLIVKHRYY